MAEGIRSTWWEVELDRESDVPGELDADSPRLVTISRRP
jgi:hypothetical protein